MICQTVPLHHVLSVFPILTTQFGTRLSALTNQQALADSAALEIVSLQHLGVASADFCILRRFQHASGVVRIAQHHLTKWGNIRLQAFKTG